MADTPRPETQQPAGPAPKKKGRGFLWALLAVVVAFGAGYLWQYFEAQDIRDRLAAVEQELAVEHFRVRLGQATMAAQAGEFEAARLQMSDLFNSLQDQMGTLPAGVEEVARDFLARRDDIITGLSRSNPAYADVLYGMQERLAAAVQRGAGAAAPPPEPAVEETFPQPEAGTEQPEPDSP